MAKKWVDHLYANLPRKVDDAEVVFSRAVGKNWGLRHASLEQLRRIVSHVANDASALVNRLREDKEALLTGKLFEVVTGCEGYDEDLLRKFWGFGFSAGDLDIPELATAFLEGVLEAWAEVHDAAPDRNALLP